MSFEAIQKVTQSEQAAQQEKADAAAQAKRIVADAQREGQRLAEQAKEQAEEQVKAMLSKAEADAAARAAQTLEANREACERMKQEARGRLEQAAGLIVERIGKD